MKHNLASSIIGQWTLSDDLQGCQANGPHDLISSSVVVPAKGRAEISCSAGTGYSISFSLQTASIYPRRMQKGGNLQVFGYTTERTPP